MSIREDYIEKGRRKKVAWNCLIWRKNWSKKFFEMFDNFFFFLTSMGGWPQRTTGKPALTRVPRAGALDRLHGATPLWSLVAMVACGNQCKPFSIVTPTRTKGKSYFYAFQNDHPVERHLCTGSSQVPSRQLKIVRGCSPNFLLPPPSN